VRHFPNFNPVFRLELKKNEKIVLLPKQ